MQAVADETQSSTPPAASAAAPADLLSDDAATVRRILQAADLDPSLLKDSPLLADRLGSLLKTFANGMIQSNGNFFFNGSPFG